MITSDPNILPSFKQTQDSLVLSYGAFIGLNGLTSGPSSQIARPGETGAVGVFVLTFRLMLSSKVARHYQKGFVFEQASSSQCGTETSEEVECTSSPKACLVAGFHASPWTVLEHDHFSFEPQHWVCHVDIGIGEREQLLA